MPEPESFESFMEDALSSVVVAPEPVAAVEPAAPTPAAPAAPASVAAAEPAPVAPAKPAEPAESLLSDKLTKMLAGQPAEPAEPATPDPAAAAVADEAPPANATPAAQKRWAEMRQDVKWRKENEGKFSQLQKDFEELKAKAVGPDPVIEKAREAEIAQIRTEREAYLKELQVSRVEATPEFRDNILKPMEGVLERGRGLAKKYTLEERDVVNALNEKDDSKRGDLLAEIAGTFSEPDRMSLYRMGDQLGDFRAQGDFVRSNAKVALEALQKSQAAQHAQRQTAALTEWSAAIDQIGSQYRANLPLLKTVEGEDEWNKGSAEIEQLVRSTKLYELPSTELVKILYQAAVLPRALNVQEKLIVENQSLRKRLSAYTAATPGAGEGESTAEVPAAADPNLGFLEAVEK